MDPVKDTQNPCQGIKPGKEFKYHHIYKRSYFLIHIYKRNGSRWHNDCLLNIQGGVKIDLRKLAMIKDTRWYI